MEPKVVVGADQVEGAPEQPGLDQAPLADRPVERGGLEADEARPEADVRRGRLLRLEPTDPLGRGDRIERRTRSSSELPGERRPVELRRADRRRRHRAAYDQGSSGATKSTIVAASRSGCSIPIMCATSGQTSARAFGRVRLEVAGRLDHVGDVQVAGDGEDRAAQLAKAVVGRRFEPDAPCPGGRSGSRRSISNTRSRIAAGTRVGGWPGPSTQTRTSNAAIAAGSRGVGRLEPLLLRVEGPDPVGRLDVETTETRIRRRRPPRRARARRSPCRRRACRRASCRRARPAPMPRRVEDGQQVVDPRELDVLGRRAADATLVVADRSVAGGGQRAGPWRPTTAEVGDPRVEEHDRRPGALVDDEQAATRNVDEAARHGSCLMPGSGVGVIPRGRSAPGRSCAPGGCVQPRFGRARRE